MSKDNFRPLDVSPATQSKYYMEAKNWGQALKDNGFFKTASPLAELPSTVGFIGNIITFVISMVLLVIAILWLIIEQFLVLGYFMHKNYTEYKIKKRALKLEKEQLKNDESIQSKSVKLKQATEEERIAQLKSLLALRKQNHHQSIIDLATQYTEDYESDFYTTKFEFLVEEAEEALED